MEAVNSRTEHALRATRLGDVEIRCLGRGPHVALADLPQRLGQPDLETAWLRQVHSPRVVAARRGACGEGDALFTDRERLALCVVTADCVPVVLGGTGLVAVAHAGWRGLVGGILEATCGALASEPTWAWIGPAIGPCCYEVGDDVAEQVAHAAATEDVLTRGASRPHADLGQAAELILRRSGLPSVERVEACTRCSPDLWSYRGDGPGAGRNVTLAWRDASLPTPDREDAAQG